ncbi:MAG: hypothetical protein DRN12_07210, partial [Thermoplasmata archaeon]
PYIYLIGFPSVGWFYFTIGSDLHRGFGVHPIVIAIPSYSPGFKIYDGSEPLHAKLNYGVNLEDWIPIPTSIGAFDIDLR